MSRMPRPRLAAVAGALVAAAAMTGTTTAHAVTDSSDTSTVSVFGNPTVPADPPSEVQGPLGAAGPAPTPATGPTPETHVYVNTRAGAMTAYGTVLAPLKADAVGARITGIDVTFTDDVAPGENLAADTAVLQICRLTGEPVKSTPDAPVTYDCAKPVTGKRTAKTDGSGSWTFHLPGAAYVNGMRSNLMFGIFSVPAEGETSTVAVKRASLAVDYTYVPRATTPDPDDDPVGSGDETTGSVDNSGDFGGTTTLPDAGGLTGVGGLPAPTGVDPIAGAPMDVAAAAPVATPYVQAAQQVSGPRRDLRPLLLLVLPLVPLIVLWTAARIGVRRGDEDLFPDLDPA